MNPYIGKKHQETVDILQSFIDEFNQFCQTEFIPTETILDASSSGADVEYINRKDKNQKLYVEHKRLLFKFSKKQRNLHFIIHKFLDRVARWDHYLREPICFHLSIKPMSEKDIELFASEFLDALKDHLLYHEPHSFIYENDFIKVAYSREGNDYLKNINSSNNDDDRYQYFLKENNSVDVYERSVIYETGNDTGIVFIFDPQRITSDELFASKPSLDNYYLLAENLLKQIKDSEKKFVSYTDGKRYIVFSLVAELGDLTFEADAFIIKDFVEYFKDFYEVAESRVVDQIFLDVTMYKDEHRFYQLY
ncbi:hypothetical protein ACFQI7_27410 [Paenibacillus allorhizosphaerae]|uniref:Uncharacterized protein n=1 Tax=Paenibacillus allorhizosphaerae TaxID=2849866 RepID=A0ABM8VNH0_9BACL|nr:hypothetical protein [Paenibacillus allorhizosphaerae]CAG7651353.1 hypothetical protein PAECIP111802_04942 [Paenibacillus allorhizosphaerae]